MIKSLAFCMVVKNEELYLDKMILSILKVSKNIPYVQIIIINDNSFDGTELILEKYKSNSDFVIKNNCGNGKISGTNLALSFCNAEYVKFVDGDDILCGDYSLLPDVFTVLYHDYVIFTDDGVRNEKNIAIGGWLKRDSYEIISKFRSIPKAMFVFKSEFIKSFFPIPTSLPFEDLWINLIASESQKIQYFKENLYRYRSHSNQYYGGNNNFNSDKRVRMANRFIAYYEYLTRNKHPFSFDFPPKEIYRYANVLLNPSVFGFLGLLNNPKLALKSIYYLLDRLVAFHWKVRR
jgi:glycosyltransferase involved in cell wall biosynthesis